MSHPERSSTPTRILVVDDNADAAESLSRLLRLTGHETRAVFDGPSALEAVGGFQPHLVLLDLGLPEMDGYEVARRIREIPEMAGARLIAVSGYGETEHRQRSAEAGFDQHLTKPVNLDALLSMIGNFTPMCRAAP